jgi:CHAT domain-containing protein
MPRLMIEFHCRLLHGERAADALRHAKLSLMRQPEHEHPFYWCPFIVVGSNAERR